MSFVSRQFASRAAIHDGLCSKVWACKQHTDMLCVETVLLKEGILDWVM